MISSLYSLSVFFSISPCLFISFVCFSILSFHSQSTSADHRLHPLMKDLCISGIVYGIDSLTVVRQARRRDKPARRGLRQAVVWARRDAGDPNGLGGQWWPEVFVKVDPQSSLASGGLWGRLLQLCVDVTGDELRDLVNLKHRWKKVNNGLQVSKQQYEWLERWRPN